MDQYSYLIMVEVPAKGPMEDLVKALQLAYDAGAAGRFEVIVTREPGYMVTFLRSTAEDDTTYLLAQLNDGADTIELAAMRQLGEELKDGVGQAAAAVIQDLLNGDAQVIDFNRVLTLEC